MQIKKSHKTWTKEINLFLEKEIEKLQLLSKYITRIEYEQLFFIKEIYIDRKFLWFKYNKKLEKTIAIFNNNYYYNLISLKIIDSNYINEFKELLTNIEKSLPDIRTEMII